MPSDDKISKFCIMVTFIFLTLTFSILSLVFTSPSLFATSSNSDNDREEGRDDSNQSDGNEINDTTISSSDDDEHQQESATNEDSDENSINDNDQLPAEPQDATTTSSQGLIQQNTNQIQPNTLSGNIGIQERPRDNAVLTSSNLTNTLVLIKPDPNLENSPGNIKVIMKVECKSTNGFPSDKAVCDTYTKDPDFIQPNDYSLTLDVTRNGTTYKSTFTGSSEGQTFTITPGEFDVYGKLIGDAYTVVGKNGGFSQFNYIDYHPSTNGECKNVIQPIAGPIGRLHAEGIIYPLTNITCTITMELEYEYFVLPKTSFGDMLQNQRMPDAVIQ
jgi:hypothetical protein